ncbi:TPA: hypothetical protein DEA21_00365 [Candidatus Uhrbacteria bacterium]|nr:hypothetical protein [Candidatus Uhrbacteria bacterium]HCU32205.1 hypothetical protein [Candidatus Uhrbacteria bacterium]
MFHYVCSFLLYWFLTLSVEAGVIFLFLKKFWPECRLSNKEIFLAVVFASSLTLPYVWFVFPYLISGFVWAMIVAEIFVVAVEMIFYRVYLRFGLVKALVISLTANLISWGVGEMLHVWFGGGK